VRWPELSSEMAGMKIDLYYTVVNVGIKFGDHRRW
jgi:hypothetical protein